MLTLIAKPSPTQPLPAAWRGCLIAVLMLTNVAAATQEISAADTAEPLPAIVTAAEPETLAAIRALIEQRNEKRAELKALRGELKASREDVDSAQIETAITELESRLDDVRTQITALATGVGPEEFDLDKNLAIDLKAEAEQLVQPFVIMLRSLTEQARQIENLRRELSIAQNHYAVAERAMAQIKSLVVSNAEGPADESVGREFARLEKLWTQRLESVGDLIAATESQLEQRQESRVSTVESASDFARSFFRDRGLNLLIGGGVFLSSLLGLRYIGRAFGSFRRARQARKNLATRVISLLYVIGSFMVAILAMLFTFNVLNDWLLVGVTLLFIVALAWIALRTLPERIEQITLYLNLGAVQEGERVFFDGIPWLVRKLDFYCELVNPVLENGEFSMPIRELIGSHSRPVSPDEPWFPTRKGDFVRIEHGLAEVLVQTPGLVEVRIEGGIRVTYTASAFYEMAPQNISHGSRAEVIFGISYKHQAIATSEFRNKMRAFVHEGLHQVLREEQIIRVDVELMSASDSSIDYGVEVDMTGDAAVHYDTVEWLLTRLCVDACNHYGWEIPYPQLVVHSAPK